MEGLKASFIGAVSDDADLVTGEDEEESDDDSHHDEQARLGEDVRKLRSHVEA